MSGTTYDATSARKAAERYERHFVPSIGQPAATGLMEAARLRPGERVLDVACGTGIVTRLAAGHVGPEGAVAGLDPNPAMLAVARDVLPAEASVSWYQAPAERMPLEDESFDVVLCGMGLQFFTDRLASLRETRRVLAPGGRFVANVPGPTPPPLQAMAEGLRRHVGPETASFVDMVFSLHEVEAVRALAEEAGFRRVQARSDPIALELGAPEEFLWNYVSSTPLAAAVMELDSEGRDRMERDFVEACAPFLKEGILVSGVRMTTVVAA